MNIWQFQQVVSKRLMTWSLFSIGAGLIMRKSNPFWKSVGNQFITWGAIDAMIALGGDIGTRNRIADMENPGLPEIKAKESRNLGRILWINAGLDVLYILFGRFLMRRDKGNCQTKGNGFGIIIQGGFLLIFDVIHALNLPDDNNE